MRMPWNGLVQSFLWQGWIKWFRLLHVLYEKPPYFPTQSKNSINMSIVHFRVVHVIVVQLLSHVQLFATPWTAAHQSPLSLTNSWSLLKFMSIDSDMLSNHLILCCHPPLSPCHCGSMGLNHQRNIFTVSACAEGMCIWGPLVLRVGKDNVGGEEEKKLPGVFG